MGVLNLILQELDPSYIQTHVARRHDEARNQYHLSGVTVASGQQFNSLIADYYSYHYSRCVSIGAKLPDFVAFGSAKKIIEHEYLRRGMDWLSALTDAKYGYNGGLRTILDILSEHLKTQHVEAHIQYVLDTYVDPTDYDEKLSLMRELVSRIGKDSPYIDANCPERYVRNYQELIRAYVDGLKRQSTIFRRL